MQKTFANILLLLFLCLLFNIILVLYCHSDLGNSLQSDSLTDIDPGMLLNTGTTKGKRSLQQRDHYIKSERWKQVSQQDPVVEEEIVQINNEEIDHQAKSKTSKRRKQDEYQHPYGQASYQRSRQGSAIAYEDSGISNSETSVRAQLFEININTRVTTFAKEKFFSISDFDRKSLGYEDFGLLLKQSLGFVLENVAARMLIEFETKLSIGVKLWVWSQSELFKGAIIHPWEFHLNLVVFFTVEVYL